MRCMCSSAMPEPVSETSTATTPVRLGGYAQSTAGRHSVLGVEKQVEKDLLQFARVAQNGRQIIFERSFQVNLGGAELVFQQLQCVHDDVIQIERRELRPAGTGKVEQAVDDF